MKEKRATSYPVKAVGRCLAALLLLGVGACSDTSVLDPVTAGTVAPALALANGGSASGIERGLATVKLTGFLDLVWPGGKGAGAPEDPDRISQAEITAFAGVDGYGLGPGTFTYRVVSGSDLHREIGVNLIWAGLEDPDDVSAGFRFIGVVVSDTKSCEGSGHGGEGGCGDEGGCSHDEGGCSHDEGGCSHDEGGCSGGGGSGGNHEPGGTGSGNVNGRTCRTGQFVIGWALDGGTPAINGDRISWKWKAQDWPKAQEILEAIENGEEIPWPCKLCEKEILGGNLILHLR